MARGDLSDEQWHCLEAVLPALPVMGRRPRDRRQVFDGIWWRARTGSPWRDVPERYGPWETLYSVFRRWQIDGTWARILADHAIGRSRGGLTTKIHLAVDSSFQVLAAVVTAGQRGDAPLFTEVMNRIRVPRPGGGCPRTGPVHVLADRAYSSREIREYLRRRQAPHAIPEKRDQAGHRRRRGSAGWRPPGFDREKYKARHTVENRIALLKHARGVATRYDKLAVRYEATVQLAVIRQAL
ncbi:IS5 family transposase [Streptomyces californicus]|uniref:IS5 family transposase n=1 Tax=Streptomyces californicus TaxID=67351 RepID=UPI0036881414